MSVALYYFSFLISSILIILVGIPLLLLIFWILDKRVLNGKFKLRWRILASIVLPLVLVAFSYAYDYYAPYFSSSQLNKHLKEDLKIGVDLPSYKIIDFKRFSPGGDDFEEDFILSFKNDEILYLSSQLDSLCQNDNRWSKSDSTYVFKKDNFDENNQMIDEVVEKLIIQPSEKMAKYVYLVI